MTQRDADTFYVGDFQPDDSLDDAISAVADQWLCDWGVYWGLKSDRAPRYLGADLWTDVQALNRDAQRLLHAATRLSRRKLPDERRTLPGWLETESQLQRKQFDEFAESLREQLSPDELAEPTWQNILEVIEGETPAERRERFFRTAIQIHAFEEFGYRPAELADRLLVLLGFLVRTKAERAQQYLRRVARCFVLDLRPNLARFARELWA